jgi:hypothetical protein
MWRFGLERDVSWFNVVESVVLCSIMWVYEKDGGGEAILVVMMIRIIL